MIVVVDDSYNQRNFYEDVRHSVGGFLASSYRGLMGSDYSVAMDCEGVSLSRVGSVELVALVFDHNPDVIYLVDLSSKSDSRMLKRRVSAIRDLCQCSTVTKVIHDCRMDADALRHLHKIDLVSVHDTSVYHSVLTGHEDANLNNTLLAYGLGSNSSRRSSVYDTNPTYWATRPWTSDMKDWAAGDVSQLLELAKRQRQKDGGRPWKEVKTKSQERATRTPEMKLETNLIYKVANDMRQFIGPRGWHIRQLQKDTGTLVYRNQAAGSNAWLVFYPDRAALAKVKVAMGYEPDSPGWRITTKIGTAMAMTGVAVSSGGTALTGVVVVVVGKLLY